MRPFVYSIAALGVAASVAACQAPNKASTTPTTTVSAEPANIEGRWETKYNCGGKSNVRGYLSIQQEGGKYVARTQETDCPENWLNVIDWTNGSFINAKEIKADKPRYGSGNPPEVVGWRRGITLTVISADEIRGNFAGGRVYKRAR